MSHHQKTPKTFERVSALIYEMLDLLQRGEDAPYSPVGEFASGKMRRLMRRGAERLRRGEAVPRFRNLWNAAQLAEICERTAERDEIRHQVTEAFLRKGREMGRLLEEDPEGVRVAMLAVYLEVLQLAEAHGPGSEAAKRYRQFQRFTQAALADEADTRRQKPFDRPHEATGAIPMIPAEVLASAPPGETIFAFPEPGQDSGRARVFMRIGIGASSWTGSFESGFKPRHDTLYGTPDHKHLLVVAGGAGYLVHAKTRKLVERIGTDIVSVTYATATELVVVHNYEEIEAFGPAGRLWKRPAPWVPSTTIPA